MAGSDLPRHSSPDKSDLDAMAVNALVEAQIMPWGPERTEATKRAQKLLYAAGCFLTHKRCYPPRNSRCVRERTHRQLQKVNIGGLQFHPKTVARMLQLTFVYRVKWAGRFVRKDAPDGTTAD